MKKDKRGVTVVLPTCSREDLEPELAMPSTRHDGSDWLSLERADTAREIDQWDQSLNLCLSRLSPEDRNILLGKAGALPGTVTINQLLATVETSAISYKSQTSHRLLEKLEPTLYQVSSFAQTITVLLQADPCASGLIWGCIYLVVEVLALLCAS